MGGLNESLCFSAHSWMATGPPARRGIVEQKRMSLFGFLVFPLKRHRGLQKAPARKSGPTPKSKSSPCTYGSKGPLIHKALQLGSLRSAFCQTNAGHAGVCPNRRIAATVTPAYWRIVRVILAAPLCAGLAAAGVVAIDCVDRSYAKE